VTPLGDLMTGIGADPEAGAKHLFFHRLCRFQGIRKDHKPVIRISKCALSQGASHKQIENLNILNIENMQAELIS
jgi:hypothetical protein